MKTHHLSFPGAILERGFWLYVWQVTHLSETYYYVGRTGDSSSKHAASAYSRLSQHLDARGSASANMLLRQLRGIGLNPQECSYEMFSFGPLFKEQETLDDHRRYRDIIAPLEVALALYIASKGLTVLGKHPKPKPYNEELFSSIVSAVDRSLFPVAANNSFQG